MSEQEQVEIQLGAAAERDLRSLSEAGIEPDRDLWPELAKEMQRTVARRRYAGLMRLAAVAAAVAAVMGLNWWWAGSFTKNGEVFATPRTSSDLPAESSATLQLAFASYVGERQILLAAVVRELENYPPEVRAEVRQSIEIIEGEMKEIEASLARTPVEPSTEMRLAGLYEMELRLLGVVSERLRGSGGASR